MKSSIIAHASESLRAGQAVLSVEGCKKDGMPIVRGIETDWPASAISGLEIHQQIVNARVEDIVENLEP